jgi:hypothetical protein
LRTLACIVAVAALLFGAPAAALAHQGNPNYRSVVSKVTPAVPGVTVSVLNYDDRLLLHNTSGKDITVLDYQGKPYVQLLADGAVDVNTNSEAYYLNEDRLGQTTVPKGLGTSPNWTRVSRAARYEWHDHRAHWMGTGDPPGLKNKSVRTKIDDWTVPVEIGGQKGSIAGTLTWVPKPKDPLPLAAIFAFAALIAVLSLAVVVVRRRRAADDDDEEGAPREQVVEAW